MESSQDFKALRDAVQPALVTVTRGANTIANEDLPFQRTVHASVDRELDETTSRMLRIASDLLKSAGKITGQNTHVLEDTDDVDIRWKGIVDVIDTLLEKTDTCLDEYTGLIKRKDGPAAESRSSNNNNIAKRPKSNYEKLDYSLKRANILKPQNAFEKPVNNFESESGPWKPLLTTKPHAQVALEQLTTFVDEEQNTQYQHPYEHEITNLQYPSYVYETREPIKYTPMDPAKPKDGCIWVDTFEGVLEMLEDLRKASEIAIDLEHHDFRTYTGLLSLMQISTREKDWIVDTLVPWRHKLEVLNEVFADPKILKVFHGAYMDIIWLQRDLGLYIVGLFDTHHASDILLYSGRSLAFLLKKFVDFDADKKYQLADWRIRPLPDEMFYYARSDTHFLLYIYDMLRNELITAADQQEYQHPDGKPLDRVLQKSKEVSLQRYEHPTLDPETGLGSRGWFNVLVKSSALLNGEQFSVYKAVWAWRDNLARREDESTPFIMTQQMMLDIARIVPTDKKALWSLLDVNARQLKVHLDDLFDVIQKAKVKGTNGPSLIQYLRQGSGAVVEEKIEPVVKPADTRSIDQLKSTFSQLWGDVPLSSTWDPSSKAPSMEGTVSIPLFSQFELTDDAPAQERPVKAEKAQPKAMPVEEDKGFTLKSGNRKRKASNVEEDAPTPASEDVEMEDAEESQSTSDAAMGSDSDAKKAEAEVDAYQEAREAKNARKAAKKAAKLAKKQQEEAEEEVDEEEEEVFDYSKAESVLQTSGNAKDAEKGGKGKKGKKGKKAFDPYAFKSGNAPAGARQMNFERAGRSATFKK
ncbi:exosome complex exonuclease rrp6 [Cladorrhinum sp. PSN259]|nr:exosome complex exonuclease rrp6 [Cladorrhinum sp. PSN259]